MTIPINIDELLNTGVIESTRIEFLSDFNPNSVIHSICAFANDIDNVGGEYLILGVEEINGSPIFPIKGIDQNKIDSILKDLVVQLSHLATKKNNYSMYQPIYLLMIDLIY